MGLFSKQSKIDKMVSRLESQSLNEARRKGGKCGNCRDFDSFRNVCTQGSGRVTSANNVCPYWKI